MLAFVVLTAGNAFFVAAEFSLVTVDRAAVDQLANAGDPAGLTVRKALRGLSFQLSGAQLGITITALLSGYLAEPAFAKLFAPVLRPLAVPGGGVAVAHVLALVVATLLSMLFGELVPKNVAIARPMPTARLTAGPMRLFSRILVWLINGLNGSANWLVRRLGVEPQEELASARSVTFCRRASNCARSTPRRPVEATECFLWHAIAGTNDPATCCRRVPRGWKQWRHP